MTISWIAKAKRINPGIVDPIAIVSSRPANKQ
jgi:hypothetical protein